MRIALFTFFLLNFGISAFAQNKNSIVEDKEQPIVVINNDLLAGFSTLKNIPSDHIVSLDVYKDNKISTSTLFLDNEKNNGIIKAKINHDLKFRSQKELNLFFGLDEVNDIYVNGYLLENKTQNIARESIAKIELIEADQLNLKKPVLNVILE